MRILTPGDQGPDVIFVAERLNQLGFGPLTSSAILDRATLAALEAFQEARQIPERGQVGDLSWLALMDSSAPISGPLSFGILPGSDEDEDDQPFDRVPQGGRGPVLGEVQLRLRVLGHPIRGEDVNGPLTQNALRALQASQCLEITGTVNSETLLALRIATHDAGPLAFYADDDDLVSSDVPLSFGGDSRDVAGEGGYRYRQHEDGAITVLAGPSRRGIGVTLRSGPAWAAITTEIGPWPKPERALREGAKGEPVRALQAQINALGFGPIDVDGAFGPGTAAALRRFQAAAGLAPSGQLDAATRARLETPWPTISLGYEGADLALVQQRLRALGGPIISCNGCYTDDTASAVRAFQRIHGLPETGDLDGVTRGHILGAAAVDLPDPIIAAEQARLIALAERSLEALPVEAQAKVRAVVMEAISWVGKREIPAGSNGGPQIDVITAGVVGRGEPRPPWCALAVSHWMKVGLKAERWQDVPLGWRNASALAFGRWGEQRGRLLANTDAAPVGSVFVMYRAGSGSDAGSRASGAAKWEGTGHTGLVIADLGEHVVTVDGNVSDRCWSCTRPKAGLLGFVTWW